MTDTRWLVRLTTQDDGPAYVHHQYVGVRGLTRIYGDTIAEVMDSISFHEGETP